MIIKLVSKRRMAVLNPLEHLLQILVVEVDRHRPPVGTVEGVLALGQAAQEGLGLPIVEVVISLDGPLTAHHNSRLHAKSAHGELAILDQLSNFSGSNNLTVFFQAINYDYFNLRTKLMR